MFYLGRRYQRPVTKRVAVFVIAASIGFVWAQGRAHMQARVSAPPEFGTPTISGTLLWHEATPLGSRWDVEHQDTNGGAYVVRLYGKRAHLSEEQPGCAITVTADIEPLPTPIIMGGYDPRRDAWFAGRRGRSFIRDIDNVDVVVMPFDEARYPCDALLFDKRAFQTRMHRQFSARKGKLVMDEISNGRLWQRD